MALKFGSAIFHLAMPLLCWVHTLSHRSSARWSFLAFPTLPHLMHACLGGSSDAFQVHSLVSGLRPPIISKIRDLRARTGVRRTSTYTWYVYSVLIPCLQSSAGDLRVRRYLCTVPDFPCPLYEQMSSCRREVRTVDCTEKTSGVRAGSEFDRRRNFECMTSSAE